MLLKLDLKLNVVVGVVEVLLVRLEMMILHLISVNNLV
jgi:hypothetical protein